MNLQLLPIALLSLAAALPGRSLAAEESETILTIDSINTQYTVIVANDVAFTLASNVSVRDAEGKTISRSNLRKGMRCEAITEAATGRGRFVIKELNACQQTR